MDWIRVAIDIADDPKIDRMAATLRIDASHAVGLIVLVFCKLPANAPHGDLTPFLDSRIEAWAGWRGKAGAFGRVFRDTLCDEHGVVSAWEKHNGAALSKAERDADRQRRFRAAKAAEREAEREREVVAAEEKARDVTRTVRVTKRVTSEARQRDDNADNPHDAMRDGSGNETRRDETNYLTTQLSPPAAPAVALEPHVAPPNREKSPQFPHFSATRCNAMHEYWQSRIGAIAYGRFRKAFGELFRKPESERATDALTDAELQEAFEHWVLSSPRGKSAPFASPEKCAQQIAAVARAVRQHNGDDTALFRAVDVIVHGSPNKVSA